MEKIYLVGGAVRDQLLGRESRDRDYVVVGATVQQMLDNGFKQVGAAFPVFLHPKTGEEFALARRERKVGVGYHGFEVDATPDVTIEEDLSRRDLTINSMAMDLETQQIIDPFNGRADLRDRVLRHTTAAFAEDPLRVLRLARFAARYDFNVANETIALCQELVAANELESLSNDRVWTEIFKMLDEPHFKRGRDVLFLTGAVKAHPSLIKLFPNQKYEYMSDDGKSPELRAYWFADIGKLSQDDLAAVRVPTELARRTHFLMAVHSLADQLLNWRSVQPHVLVEFFDRFRPELSDPTVDVRLRSLLVNVTNSALTESFIAELLDVVATLRALDFKTLLRGVHPRQIKEFVLDKKADAVQEHAERFSQLARNARSTL